MGASITLAGESLIAQKQGAQQILTVSRFILANVPGLDPNGPVDRAAGKPAAGQIVGTYDVTDAGYVNPNQVVYSLMMGSDIGDFDWNWIGLETAENVLLMVAYVPTQQKRRNIPPLQLGNNVTRNFLVVFDGAQALTGLTIDASTWQHDFTVRLAGIDERERQSNRDIFGRACFFGSALQLEKVGAVYQLKPGTAYVEGVRLQRSAALPVVPPAFPTTAWLDVALQRELNDVVASWSVVWGAGKVDYVDSAGVQHYCVAIAVLPNSNTITDSRSVEDIAGPLIEHFASRAFVRAELEKLDSKQSVRVATTANIVLSGLQTIDGVALSAGDRVLVKNQGTAAQNGIYTVASGAWMRAGDADLSLEVTPGMLVPVEQGAINGDSLWQLVTDAPITLGTTGLTFEVAAGPVGLAAGTYRSMTVDKRGRVIGGTNPTTLAGYGITDALRAGDFGGPKAATARHFLIALDLEDSEVSWNTLVNEGLHSRIIKGSNPDGPGSDIYFYCRTYVRIPLANGVGALQQFAEPYGTPTNKGQMFWRGLNGNTWTDWVKVMDSADHATQAEAESGTAESLWMSPLRVFQAIAKKVVQATETVLGIARVATQAQTNTGTDDTVIVTPKKLAGFMLGGFSYLFGNSGYFILPSWLGSFIFQWTQVPVTTSSGVSVTWPLEFPNSIYYAAPGAIPENTPNFYFGQMWGLSRTGFNLSLYGNPSGSAPISTSGQTVYCFGLGR
ncbi:phage tail protein [Pseudomonas aeruginosa]